MYRCAEHRKQWAKRKVQEPGIDIDDIAGGVAVAEIREDSRNTLDDPLYKRSHEFTMEMHRILAVDSHVVEGAQEYMDDFSWQHTVVTAKVYRLGDGEWMRRARMMQGIQRQWPQVTDYLHHGF